MLQTLDERAGTPRHDMWLPEPKPAAAEGDTEAEPAEEEEEEEEDPDAWESQPVQTKLAAVLESLRERHLYCLFCAHQVRLPRHAGSRPVYTPPSSHRTRPTDNRSVRACSTAPLQSYWICVLV